MREPIELGGGDEMRLWPHVTRNQFLRVIINSLGEVRGTVRQFGEPAMNELQWIDNLEAGDGAELLFSSSVSTRLRQKM